MSYIWNFLKFFLVLSSLCLVIFDSLLLLAHYCDSFVSIYIPFILQSTSDNFNILCPWMSKSC